MYILWGPREGGGHNIPSRDVQPVSPELHIYIGLLSAEKTAVL